jgi:hypothetical protein
MTRSVHIIILQGFHRLKTITVSKYTKAIFRHQGKSKNIFLGQYQIYFFIFSCFILYFLKLVFLITLLLILTLCSSANILFLFSLAIIISLFGSEIHFNSGKLDIFPPGNYSIYKAISFSK